jgi:hypothetical protein
VYPGNPTFVGAGAGLKPVPRIVIFGWEGFPVKTTVEIDCDWPTSTAHVKAEGMMAITAGFNKK